MSKNKKKMKLGIGDIEYSELSKSLKFTVVLNETAVSSIAETLFTDILSPEEVALAAKDILHRGIIMDLTRGGMRSPVINPFGREEL